MSTSGVGYSIGGKGFRTGVNARGRRYTSVSVPGTGLRYTKSGGKGTTGCLLLFGLIAVAGAIGACLLVA